MYSGSDSTGSQNYNQWPLNPAAYQNTPNEQIDWAALAQQWIIMKEAGPPVPDQITASIPPPTVQKVKKDNLSEGGEAPMEVENEKEDDTQAHWNDNNTADSSWNWNQQQQWGWSNTWSAPSGVPPPGTAKTPLLPTPPSYNQYSAPSDGPSNFGGYNRPPTNDYSGGYWTAGGGNKMKPHNKRYSKVNIPTRPPIATPTTPDPVMLDATKRKQLPAWIREGLEKMERDKQKQLEKEREKLEKEDQVEKSKLNEKEALEIIKSTVKEREKSRFESDGEDSEIESNNKERVRETPESVVLTHEELMLKVRHTMTEILLKVTNQEIRAVCKEEFQRLLRKNKASDQRVAASSGTNISAKLGLGIYGDSGSSSGDSDDESERNRDDSDLELKDTIKRRKAEFSKTEREIEERLAAAEKHVDEDSRGGTPKADDCDSQVDAKSQGHRTKSIEDGTPPKITKRVKCRRTSSSSSTKSDSEYDKHTDHKDRKITRSKKSSSSESSYDQKSKSRNKRNRSSKDSRSITPERKRIKDKSHHNSDRKTKHSESSSSKSSSSRSRKSRSKSVEPLKKRRSRSTDKYHRESRNHKNSYSKRSHSRSSSRSRRSRSYTRSHRSESRSRRSRSYTKSDKSRRSRSQSRSEHSHNSRSRTRSERSHRSRSRDRRSRSTNRSRRSHSRHRSKSYSPHSHRQRRLKSRSNSRGKRSHRH